MRFASFIYCLQIFLKYLHLQIIMSIEIVSPIIIRFYYNRLNKENKLK